MKRSREISIKPPVHEATADPDIYRFTPAGREGRPLAPVTLVFFCLLLDNQRGPYSHMGLGHEGRLGEDPVRPRAEELPDVAGDLPPRGQRPKGANDL